MNVPYQVASSARRSILFTGILIVLLFIIPSVSGQAPSNPFYAYHTKQSHTSTDYFGKYADLIVVIGEGQTLEFTRQTNYTPRWVTPAGTFMVDQFFPDRDIDYTFDYNYVRVIEDSPEKIVVHWRYVPDISSMVEANEKVDPLYVGGFTNVVHEVYTIYPSGKVERSVKDARNSKYHAWIKEDYAHKQILELTDEGIIYGPVQWGSKYSDIPVAEANTPIINRRNLPKPFISLSFDEGSRDFTSEEAERLFNRFARRNSTGLYTTPDPSIDQVNMKVGEVSGHGALYKKGVSGSALAFDGYYTGVKYDYDQPLHTTSFSLEGWLALDVFPYNNAPIIHQSVQFGEKGFYLGINPYGNAVFTVNGNTITSDNPLPLHHWTHIAATVDGQTARLYVNAVQVGEISFENELYLDGLPISIGINTEKMRCSDPVRGPERNIPFIYGIQGLLDEIRMYNKGLSKQEVNNSFMAYLPKNTKADLEPAVLPGENGISEKFGATCKTLSYHETWDRMWRLTDMTDIVVKFDDTPASVVYWHGANYGAGWVTDNNRWLADQSSEIGGPYGCSEHMADKQCRHSYARIIENNDARVVIHWRHPCVDVGYCSNNNRNWADEYHTIYPDGTGVRKVIFNNSFSPGFQDIQYFSNPGETALDVLHLNAMNVANLQGDIQELYWEKPNKIPKITIEEPTIEWLNPRSAYKVFTVFPGPGLNPWGEHEQSAHTDDPFAGPWNHWPVSLCPSDGRFAVAHDRVTHFAIAAHDPLPRLGSVMMYGFTNEKIDAVIPVARAWQNPAPVSNIRGVKSLGFNRDEKAYEFDLDGKGEVHFTIEASNESPVVNPCIVLYHCERDDVSLKINGKEFTPANDLRIGRSYDTNGEAKTIIWLNFSSEKRTGFAIAW